MEGEAKEVGLGVGCGERGQDKVLGNHATNDKYKFEKALCLSLNQHKYHQQSKPRPSAE